MKTTLLVLVVFSAVLLAGCNKSGDATAGNATSATGSAAQSAATGATFASVQPVLSKCTGCHGATNPKGGYNLTSYQTVMASQGLVKAGDPANSVIVQALRGANGHKQMPPKGPLPEDQIKSVEDWIKAGAKES